MLTGFILTAPVGGALSPVIIGNMGDMFGLGAAFNFLFLPLLIIFSIAFGSKPIVANKTIRSV